MTLIIAVLISLYTNKWMSHSKYIKTWFFSNTAQQGAIQTSFSFFFFGGVSTIRNEEIICQLTLLCVCGGFILLKNWIVVKEVLRLQWQAGEGRSRVLISPLEGQRNAMHALGGDHLALCTRRGGGWMYRERARGEEGDGCI